MITVVFGLHIRSYPQIAEELIVDLNQLQIPKPKYLNPGGNPAIEYPPIEVIPS
jgi:hypothetical protein